MRRLLVATVMVVLALFNLQAFAADIFVCTVDKTVMKNSICTICIERRAENCEREAEVACLIEGRVETGVKDSILHPSGDIFLGATDNDVSFIFSHTKSGYTARVTSLRANAEASVSSTKRLDFYLDTVSITAKTSQSRNVAGNVTSVILSCQPE